MAEQMQKGRPTLSQERRNPAFARMISDFIRLRGPLVLPPRDVEALRDYLVAVYNGDGRLPCRGAGLDWRTIAASAGIDAETLIAGREALRPGLEAMRRELRKRPSRPPPTASLATAPSAARTQRAYRHAIRLAHPPTRPTGVARGSTEPAERFHMALDRLMRTHGDTASGLKRELAQADLPIEYSTLRMWRLGLKAPAHAESLEILEFLERRWALAPGYFSARLPHPSRAIKAQAISGIGAAERRRLAWHLPDDFDRLSPTDREEILEWVRRVVVTGATDYRRYQSAAMKHRFAVRFPEFQPVRPRRNDDGMPDGRRAGTIIAPPELAREMRELLAFKTTTLTRIGYRRRGVWGTETASQKVELFGLMFGALAAPPEGPVKGFGAPVESLGFGLLALPAVWDWYLRWREQRRGFFTAWETDMLCIAVALTGPETGWLTQTPSLAERLQPLPGLVSTHDIDAARADWPAACAALHRFALARSKEIARVARVHHDPFEPILPVLEADSPVGEYRKIADEILALRPCAQRYPLAAAESARAFLMIRLGLQLGFRQKNFRQLLVCAKGEAPRSERQLADRLCGELRWSDHDRGWEVFVPPPPSRTATRRSSVDGRSGSSCRTSPGSTARSKPTLTSTGVGFWAGQAIREPSSSRR
jgi:hypothetical protein